MKDSIKTAVEQGLNKGIIALAAEKADKEQEIFGKEQYTPTLREAFNNASDLIAGFNILKNMPGSRFKFEAKEASNDTICISAKIDMNKISKEMEGDLEIFVDAKGSIQTFGQENTSEELITATAQHAKIQGLIP